MKSTSTTAYSFPHSMTREDIESWRDLLELPRSSKPNAMLISQAIADELPEFTGVADLPLLSSIGVHVIPDEEVDWVPGLGKGRVVLCQREHVVRILQWLGHLRTLPESTRNQLIELAKKRYAEKEDK